MTVDLDDIVKAVIKHAEENYNSGGWDYIVECWTPREIYHRLFDRAVFTLPEALADFTEVAATYDERRREVQSEAF